MKRHYLTLDLIDDPELIAEYENYHRAVWPEILATFKQAGIERMEIYRWQNRLCMIMEVNATFSFEKKANSDASNPRVLQWEELMGKYQQALPGTKPGEKWQLMHIIFSTEE